ncbi:cyclodeaminase/cyclohydrolase family protein [Kocuria coralli]|uniref:Cyclodeaminase/cyclohydrolase family protein n=1 Tax=Kocuria coralli TaxID=1461025 RepID=A0A5J5KVG2_9MICC|nr:cyclodeaminase/cyclohydrolase family protein [Kocuria coralli]KAA9393679.1 cyclodeaminase/cyclohydrolase family protein [Kocuria coralli]
MIRHATIEQYVEQLASGEPTPGGGATAAIEVAHGAGLVAMAARFSDQEDLAGQCGALASRALGLSDDDEQAFAQVAEAYDLPREDERQRRERSNRIQQALRAATAPPKEIAEAAAQVVDLAGKVLAGCNPNVLSDVGAGLGAVRGAVVAAVLTLETDLAPLHDEGVRAGIHENLQAAEDLIARSDDLIREVRGRIRG